MGCLHAASLKRRRACTSTRSVDFFPEYYEQLQLANLSETDGSVAPAEATPDVAPITELAPFFLAYEDDVDDSSE